MGSTSPIEVDELVLVVHGVGDPAPGATLSLFARSVAEASHPLTETQEVLWLEEEPSHPRDIKTFSTHVRRLHSERKETVLAEVYWGDLSRVKAGLLGVLFGLIEIVFGLRYVAFVASQQKGLAPQGLQALGLACSKILHGPLLAVNFVLAAMLLTVAGTETGWPCSSHVIHWSNFLVFGCSGLCLVSSFLGWRLTRNPVCHQVLVLGHDRLAVYDWGHVGQHRDRKRVFADAILSRLGLAARRSVDCDHIHFTRNVRLLGRRGV